jgi:hypothetical protein
MNLRIMIIVKTSFFDGGLDFTTIHYSIPQFTHGYQVKSYQRMMFSSSSRHELDKSTVNVNHI